MNASGRSRSDAIAHTEGGGVRFRPDPVGQHQLNPTFSIMWGIGLRWLRDGKVVEDYHILHGSEETDEYRLSPIRATIERGTPLQRRLDRPVLGSRAQGVFGRASPAHDRPAKGSHATPPLPLRRVAQNSAQRRLVCRVTEARPPAEGIPVRTSSTGIAQGSRLFRPTRDQRAIRIKWRQGVQWLSW